MGSKWRSDRNFYGCQLASRSAGRDDPIVISDPSPDLEESRRASGITIPAWVDRDVIERYAARDRRRIRAVELAVN